MGSVNLLFHPKKELSTRLNISTFQLKRRNDYGYFNQYELPDNEISYNENQQSTTRSQIWQADFQMEKNTSHGYLKSVTSAKIPYEQVFAHTISNDKNYEQSLRTPFLSISNQTNLIKLGKAKNLLQYNSTIQYYQTSEHLRISPGILTVILNDSTGYLQFQQNVNTHNLFINQSVNYQKQIGGITFSAISGISFLRNTLSSMMETTDSTQYSSILGIDFQNNINFNQLDLYTELETKFKIKEWRLQAKISPSYQQINYNLTPVSHNKEHKGYLMLSPSITIDKDWNSNSSIHASYLHQASNGLIGNIYQGSIVSDYRSISANKSVLPRGIQNSFGIRYAFKRPLKLFFYNIFASYIRINNNIINSFIIDSGVTKQTSILYHNVNPLFTIGGGASKYLFFLKTNISGNIFYRTQSGYNYNNELPTPFDMKSYTANITAKKKLLKSGVLSVKLNENILESKQSAALASLAKSRYWRQDVIFDWQHGIGEHIQYQISFTAYANKQGSQPSSRSQFLDFSLQYNPFKWKGYFELQCLNLLNEKQYEELSLRSNGFSILHMPLRERRLLLKYTFNF